MSMRSILLVDDQPHQRRMVSVQLERAGLRVEEANNGHEALAWLADDEFDVVVTDVDMPSMNGRELCTAIAERFGSEGPLLLVLTGLPEDECAGWVSALPQAELFDKPVSVRRLLARIRDHLGDKPEEDK